MGLIEATESCLAKYAVFPGRASRSEYWYFSLFLLIIYFFLAAVSIAIFAVSITFFAVNAESDLVVLAINEILDAFFGVNAESDLVLAIDDMFDAISLIALLPSIAVCVRRLHDIDKSGYWCLLTLTVIGVIPLLYWACKKGDEKENRFGPNPLASNKKIAGE